MTATADQPAARTQAGPAPLRRSAPATPDAAPDAAPVEHPRAAAWVRWLPLVATVAYVVAVLLAADTAPTDLLRYAGYLLLALILPGTLVYRALRRRPHTLVEDLAMGAAVGLVLELPAWAVASALDIRGWLWTWPVLVVVPFAAVPRLRRHWVVRGYTQAPVGWSWSVGGVVAFFTTYLSSTFLERNPVVPNSENTRQYLDLAYQLSLAGEAKHHLPLHVPQVADEPLYYHWFGYAHMASTSLIGGIDLPVVAMRLAIPALCAAAIVLTAVVGWRLSGKPYVGAVAAALFFVVGETNFTHPVTMPFGSQASFVVWHGMSMIYSWVLLIALLVPLAALVERQPGDDPRIDRHGVPRLPVPGAFVLATLLLFASAGAKASSLPTVGPALLFVAVVLLITRRRIPWLVVGAGALTAIAQLFAMAVLYHFEVYEIGLGPMSAFEDYVDDPVFGLPHGTALFVVLLAFLINMQLRVAGVVPLLWRQRLRLEPTQLLLLGGAVAGPGIYLMTDQPADANQYFTRAGFAFAVVLSAWGYVEVFDRARLSRVGRWILGVATLAFATTLVAIQFRFAEMPDGAEGMNRLLPLLRWALILTAAGFGGAAIWLVASRWVKPMRGRGALVALTAILVVGAPGLLMDMKKSQESPNGGAYALVSMPASVAVAARWVRDHSSPNDVLATNAHCLYAQPGYCDARLFSLSAYSERRVLVEGWSFAPRVSASGVWQFWDGALLTLNDRAFTDPNPEVLAQLHDRYGVRWLVADRQVLLESTELGRLAKLRYENGRMAVYELA